MPGNRAHLLILKLSAKTHWRNYSRPWALRLFSLCLPTSPHPHNSCKICFIVLLELESGTERSPGRGLQRPGQGGSVLSAPVLLLRWRTKKMTAIKEGAPTKEAYEQEILARSHIRAAYGFFPSRIVMFNVLLQFRQLSGRSPFPPPPLLFPSPTSF